MSRILAIFAVISHGYVCGDFQTPSYKQCSARWNQCSLADGSRQMFSDPRNFLSCYLDCWEGNPGWPYLNPETIQLHLRGGVNEDGENEMPNADDESEVQCMISRPAENATPFV
jgi:hypothetical protein